MTTAIITSGANLQGNGFPTLAQGVSIGVCAWMVSPSNFALNGVCTGTAGSGSVLGKYTVTPNVGTVLAGLQSAGMKGTLIPEIASAIALGVANACIATASYQGVSVGVGTGTDISTVVLSNPTTLALSIASALQAVGYTGGNILPLSNGLGIGLASMLQTGTGTGTVIGASGPTPATGTSISRIL